MAKYLTTTLLVYLLFQGPVWGGDVNITVNSKKSDEPAFIDNAVFYLVADEVALPQPSEPHRVRQQGRQFSPFISVVQTGTPIAFPNRDETAHHVYSFSAAKSFELPLYKKQTPEPIVFDQPGVVAIGCNIHDWMEAYILVVNTPYHQMMLSNTVEFAGVPPGLYTVYFWYPGAERTGIPSRPVEVSDSDSSVVTFPYPKKYRKVRQQVAPVDDYEY